MAVAHKGSISMGLVLIPVGHYKTTIEKDIHFYPLCQDSKERFQQKKKRRHHNKRWGRKDSNKG